MPPRRAIARAASVVEEKGGGARPRELRASGERLRRGPSADLTALTPQELEVALVIASGASYKDGAARLFVSRRRSSFHMNTVGRKPGSAARLELTGRLSETDAGMGG